ncbi:hypothetical protein N7471_001311 [Penicillium samsonianum]|uniref:uncharacterized protein n=1 Tax=Penicillium samsonianum TaxID=1882272 RepID=UPI002547B2F4|nr:uncharacterized protein N7471_001311 [Penicillium samsonianum]KAJ6150112.1 hypothetical protein N7471_001311 [Penicillium samsonianum]
MNKEPCAFTTVAMFRDYIRAMYNCRELGLNLHSVMMRYTSPIHDEDLPCNILRDEWDLTTSTMMGPSISHFRLDVTLRANECEDEETYGEALKKPC